MIRGLNSPFLFLVFILTMVLNFSSCCRKNASSQTQNEEISESKIQQSNSPQDIQINGWDNIYAIEIIHGKAIDKEEYTEGLPRLELQIQQGRLVGFTGCNSFQAQAKLIQNEDEVIHIEIGPILTTKRGCPEAIDEQQFLQSLESATSILLSNNRIFFINMEGVITLQGLIVD